MFLRNAIPQSNLTNKYCKTRERSNNLIVSPVVILLRVELIQASREDLYKGRFIYIYKERERERRRLARNWRKFSTRLNETRMAERAAAGLSRSKSYACPKATPCTLGQISDRKFVSLLFSARIFGVDHRCEILGDFCGGYGTGLFERKIRHGCSIKQTIRRRLGKALPDKLRAIKLPSPHSPPPFSPALLPKLFFLGTLVCLNKPAKENSAFQRLLSRDR